MQNALINYLFIFYFFFVCVCGGGGRKILHSELENIVFIIHLLYATNSEMYLRIRIRFCNSYFLSKHKF